MLKFKLWAKRCNKCLMHMSAKLLGYQAMIPRSHREISHSPSLTKYV